MKAKRVLSLFVLGSLVLVTTVWIIAIVWAEPAPPMQQHIVVQSGQPESFDPHRATFPQDIAIARMLWRGLYQLEATPGGGVQPEPAMAAGAPSVNGNVYTVTLKPGLEWSDEQPLTAMDFEYGIKRACDPNVASPYQYLLGESNLNIVGCDAYFQGQGTREDVGVTAVNATTLDVTLVAPKPTFTTIMSLWVAFPAREDVITQHGDDWTDPANIVVNGPFTLTGLVPGAGGRAVLEPNPEWPLEPEPTLHKITIRFTDDLEVAFQAFQDGALDMTNVPASKIPIILADPTLSEQFLKVGGPRIWAVEMQMGNPTLADFNVRLALSRAIDRNALVNLVYGDAYLPANYWLVQGLPGFQGNAAFENIIGYSPGAAQTALADAGYPNGQGFPTLTLTVLDRPDRIAEAEFLQDSWNTILGINVAIEAVDAETRSQVFNSENFDLFMGGWENDYPDPENSLIGLFDTTGANNRYNCSDPDIDAKLSAAATETNNAARITLLQEAETLLVTGLCGVAPVYQTASLYLVKSDIGGVTPNGQIDAAMPGGWCPECWFVVANCEPGVDTDSDSFKNDAECYVATDPRDACPDWEAGSGLCPGPSCDGDDCWPPDVNVDRVVDVQDAVTFLAAFPSAEGSASYSRRLDMAENNGVIDVIDAVAFLGRFPSACTNP
jgi:oligopeptide transport system substrate-binding protein